EVRSVDRSILPVTQHVGRNLVQVWTVDEVVGVRPDVVDLKHGMETDILFDGCVPLNHSGIYQIPLVGASIARARCGAGGRTSSAVTIDVGPRHGAGTSGGEV